MKKLYERAYVFFQKYPLMISIGYMCIYFPIFSLLEQFCDPRYVIHSALDDMIPFNEWFVIPYAYGMTNHSLNGIISSNAL